MAINKLNLKYRFDDKFLNIVLEDYKDKINYIIDNVYNQDDADTSYGLFVPKTTTISTTSPLSGGGALSGNLTLALTPGVINFTGATGENLIKMPDNELDALSIQEGANKYLTFDTVDDEEDIIFYKSVDILHTSTHADDHALEIDTDAAAFGDVKAIDIDYITGAISTGEDEAPILINIDETASTGGDVFGLEVLATEGSAGIYGMKVGVVIGPVHQDSGTFINPTTGTDNTVSTDVAAMIDGDSGTTTAIFEHDDEYILIGNSAAFEEMEFIITTNASGGGIMPTFWYSTAGAHTFTQFTPVDGTDGFRHTGVVAWDASDLSSHAVNTDTGTYDIKVIRTRNNLGTTPILGYAKTAATTEYIWDKDGDVNIRHLRVSDGGNIGSVSDTDAIAIASGGEVTLSQTLILSDVVNASTDANKFLVLDGSSNVDFRTGANVLADLSGDAGAAFSWNSQNLSSVGTIGCGTITSTGNLIIADAGNIGSATDTDAIAIASDGKTTFTQDLKVNEDIIIGDTKYIGSASDPDAMQIEADGDIVMTQDLAITGTLASNVATITGGATIKTAATDGILYIDTYDTTPSDYSQLRLRTSDSDTMGTVSETQDGDTLGQFLFHGVDSGSNFDIGATILCVQNGASGGRVPCDMKLITYSSTSENSNQIVLYNDGKVAFGTATPGNDIHFYRSGVCTVEIESNTDNSYLIINSNTDNVGAEESGFFFQDNSNNKWEIYKGTDNDFKIYNYADTSIAMEIEADGDVLLPSIPSTDAGDYDLRYDAAQGVVYDTSDIRQKKNIKSLDYGLAEVLQLEPKSYKYYIGKTKKDKDGNKSAIKIAKEGKDSFGLIAQEVWDIIPEAVYKPEDEKTTFWGLRYKKLIPILINAIKELNDKIIVLEAQ